MPYSRPTLTELKADVSSDIASSVKGVDPLLRFSNLQITGMVQAQLTNLQYGFIDYVAKNAVPFTSEGEYLVGWAGLKNVRQKAAVPFVGTVSFPSSATDAKIDASTGLTRGDGTTYTTNADASVGTDGNIVVSFTATDAGADGTCAVGTILTLETSVTGVQSDGTVTAVTTPGTDIETKDDFRSRMLKVYRQPPQGGSKSDYETWALSVTGCTRAWAVVNGWGIGTVVVYVMFDIVEAAFGGIPQGANGVAAKEPRGAAATGDQLTVANYIYTVQPITPLVYVLAPQANTVNFTIRGLASASATIKSAVAAAISTVFADQEDLASTVYIADLETAIASAAGTEAFGITLPAADITSGATAVPVLGTITWI
ncbi:baseplate J/gp47 family protein [Telmatospirillum sp.]|uniref:baseplate J/gp47 family protein n=1 Tax=Telmatospirillum sp. TaxID=2079197 RepID=UPI0028468905|nr:baseplate J/gp47 family protein [Telmatospirillum sp.]MDR3438942.1 baseplate J/gp47 family protein [Telmatospirillum sp.]